MARPALPMRSIVSNTEIVAIPQDTGKPKLTSMVGGGYSPNLGVLEFFGFKPIKVGLEINATAQFTKLFFETKITNEQLVNMDRMLEYGVNLAAQALDNVQQRSIIQKFMKMEEK